MNCIERTLGTATHIAGIPGVTFRKAWCIRHKIDNYWAKEFLVVMLWSSLTNRTNWPWCAGRFAETWKLEVWGSTRWCGPTVESSWTLGAGIRWGTARSRFPSSQSLSGESPWKICGRLQLIFKNRASGLQTMLRDTGNETAAITAGKRPPTPSTLQSPSSERLKNFSSHMKLFTLLTSVIIQSILFFMLKLLDFWNSNESTRDKGA